MAASFLKQARVRDLTLMDMAMKSEDECYELFKTSRWGTRGTQICNHCGAIDNHYFRKNRKQWRCKHCDAYFSVTTGTLYQDRKMSFKKIMMGLMYFIGSAAGTSYHEFSRDMDVQTNVAMVFYGKLDEMIAKKQSNEKMRGLVQIDGGYFGGRPRNGRLRRKHDPIDVANHVEAKLQGVKLDEKKQRNRTAIQNFKRRQNRRIVMVIRECFEEKGLGGKRTRVEICKSENELEVNQLAQAYIEVDPSTYIMTDDCPAYNSLSNRYEHDTVPHAIMFSTPQGVNDNQAESYFSRLRRYVKGVALKSPKTYMYDKATTIAWREDFRRSTNQEKFDWIMNGVLTHGLSRNWRGYFQGFMRRKEILWSEKYAKIQANTLMN